VVAALLNMVAPDRAWFGEKDYQQLQLVRRMAKDLHFATKIIGVPTVREADGLAMSSRNARLTAEQRAIAPVVSRGLQAAVDAYAAGETRADVLLARAREVLAEQGEKVKVEYVEVVDGESLTPGERAKDDTVIAAAVWLGDVRLIDNMVLGRARSTHVHGAGGAASSSTIHGGANPHA
jgi:pantoate--beta-alanine ligase